MIDTPANFVASVDLPMVAGIATWRTKTIEVVTHSRGICIAPFITRDTKAEVVAIAIVAMWIEIRTTRIIVVSCAHFMRYM